MHFSYLSVSTAVLASIVIAIPSQDGHLSYARTSKTSFSLPAAYSPARKIRKRSPVVPPIFEHRPRSLPSKEQSEVELQPAYMTVTMGVGTPPQPQTVTFDTGTGNLYVDFTPYPILSRPALKSDSWVFGGAGKGLFHSSASSSFKNVTTKFQSNPGSQNGYYAQDTITLGAVALPQAWFGLADSTASTGQGGAMGMAPPAADKNAYGSKSIAVFPCRLSLLEYEITG